MTHPYDDSPHAWEIIDELSYIYDEEGVEVHKVARCKMCGAELTDDEVLARLHRYELDRLNGNLFRQKIDTLISLLQDFKFMVK